MRSAIGVLVFPITCADLLRRPQDAADSALEVARAAIALAIGAMYGFFYGLSKMPLVNALTLGFHRAANGHSPVEHLPRRPCRLAPLGRCGCRVYRHASHAAPGKRRVYLRLVAILIAAFCYATQAITARYLKIESMLSMAVYVVLVRCWSPSFFINDETWITPDSKGWILMLGAGLCSVVAWIGFINGYRGTSPAILAPFEYAALIGGAIAGYLIWGEVPDRWVLAGGMIIIASGLYVVYREVGRLN